MVLGRCLVGGRVGGLTWKACTLFGKSDTLLCPVIDMSPRDLASPPFAEYDRALSLSTKWRPFHDTLRGTSVAGERRQTREARGARREARGARREARGAARMQLAMPSIVSVVLMEPE